MGDENLFFERLSQGGLAGRLELFELLFVLLDAAANSLFIKREGLKVFAVGEPDARLTDGGEDLGAIGVGG